MENYKKPNIEEIIALFIKELKKRSYEITSTKIQKLLYLIDYYYKKRFDEIYTGLKWKYHLFGPYNDRIAQITSEEFQPFNYHNFLILEVKKDDFSPRFRQVFNYVMRNFANSPLNELLEFVYYETEPMLFAKRGEILDFSKVEPLTKIYIPKDNAKALFLHFKKLTELVKDISSEDELVVNDAPNEIYKDDERE